MGIVNVTPDSFSDGGQFLDSQAAIAHAQKLVSEGADLLDIGGESTRPYAEPVSQQTELDRVLPVIEAVCKLAKVPVSIDTSKAAVASAAVAVGAEIINDVTALRGDAKILEVVCQTGAGICVMHMQGTPQTMQDNPHYGNVFAEVFAFLRERRDHLISAGMELSRICLDPGIGFGKTPQHNLTLLANCWRLHELGCPVLVGHSRKSFLNGMLGSTGADRTAAGIGVSCALAAQSVQILRVHDVAQVRHALMLFEAVGTNRGQPTQAQ
ncbi:MAG TPA: dihydropteroate synthase [Pirellulales bacterium]|jgi:dihydropteroate synthase|nr:dihydropteroate synthase [Pirellulales bacterium]